MLREFDKKIILESGQEFYGYSFGASRDKLLEIVFNTSMVGYQEILSDPSYTDQAVVMTYPLIGNYGMAREDYETQTPSIGALIVHDYNDEPSNFRSEASLSEIMEKYGITGIAGIDTRRLTRLIRDHGTGKALITDAAVRLSEGMEILQSGSLPQNAVSRVSRTVGAVYGEQDAPFHVVVIDCGVKKSILQSLVRRGCRVTVLPWNSSPGAILSACPDGVLVSNGPGDPNDIPQTIKTVKDLIGKCPLFGICLGHQVLSLAYGAKTYKLKFGHRGGNHPVKNLETGKIEITSQNHSYAVDRDSLPKTPLSVTHVNLLDQTVEGVQCDRDRAFGVQYHPESAPGPQDSADLFDQFISTMKGAARHA